MAEEPVKFLSLIAYLVRKVRDKKLRVKMFPKIIVTPKNNSHTDILQLQQLMVTMFCKEEINVKFNRKHHLKSEGLK